MDGFFVIAYSLAAHFAQLSELSQFFLCYCLTEVFGIVGLMSLVQIVYQFYLYPYVFSFYSLFVTCLICHFRKIG
jgi:hypothetical protein